MHVRVNICADVCVSICTPTQTCGDTHIHKLTHKLNHTHSYGTITHVYNTHTGAWEYRGGETRLVGNMDANNCSFAALQARLEQETLIKLGGSEVCVVIFVCFESVPVSVHACLYMCDCKHSWSRRHSSSWGDQRCVCVLSCVNVCVCDDMCTYVTMCVRV